MKQQELVTLNKSWEECEKLYLRSYELDKTRGESLYFIGIHYFLLENQNQNENYKIAYDYMIKCLETGFSYDAQYNVKPTLYFYFLPKFLTYLCYIFKDYENGLKCCDLFLSNVGDGSDKIYEECFNSLDLKTILSWKSIYQLLVSKPTNIIKKENTSSLPYFVFMQDGGFSKWTGKDILTKGVGGSETFTIEMARNLQKLGYFQVIVFCNCEENEIFEGVEYRKINEYFSFVLENNVHSCMIGRYSEYYPYTIDSTVENIYLIAHDLDFTGNILPIDKKLKKVFCLSEWHVEYFKNIYPSLNNLLEPFGYGINEIMQMNPVWFEFKNE